jgi:hypothetical protein
VTVQSVALNDGSGGNGRFQVLNCGIYTLGAGCVATAGALVSNSGTGSPGGGSAAGSPALIGAGGAAGVARFRVTGTFVSAIAIVQGSAELYGVDVTNAGATPMLRIEGVASSLVLNDVVGSTGNTGNGLDLTRCRGVFVFAGTRAANSFATSGSAIVMADNTVYALADYAVNDLKDAWGNRILGSAATKSGTLVSAANDAFANIGQYAVVRATTAGGAVRAAIATSLGASIGLLGVTQAACTTTQTCGIVTSGTTWLQFDAAPTVANLAFLSTATAGNAQVAEPSAGNQRVRLGRVVQVSGSLGLVQWEPDVEATTLANGQLLIGSAGAAPVAASITGTANQVNVANGAGAIVLSTPQNIHTAATPTFAAETLTAVANQLVLGTTNTATISATAPAASRTYTIADPGASANFVMDTAGNMVITNAGTANQFLAATNATAAAFRVLAASDIPALDASKITTGALPVARGGTNSGTALNNNRIMVSSGGAIVEAAALTNGQLLIGSTGSAPVAAAITGTANQVIVTNGAGTITLSTPQNTHTAATPTFASETLTAVSNQLTLGTTNTVTLSATAPAASRTITVHDAGANAHVLLHTAGAMTVTNAAVTGYTIKATSTTTATWQDPMASGGMGRYFFYTGDTFDSNERCFFPVGGGHNVRVMCDTLSSLAYMPVACTLQGMYVYFGTAPGVGTSRTLYLCTNTIPNCLAGATPGSLGCGAGSCISCTISGTSRTCDTGASSVSVTAGNAVQWRYLGTGGPASSDAIVSWQCA